MLLIILWFVVSIFLQIHLSKKDSRVLGLILPALSLFIAMFFTLGMAVFFQEGQLSVIEIVNGEVISSVISEGGNRGIIPGAIGGVIYVFLLLNIPTVILLIIYKVLRSKQNQKRNVEKMSVQDL